jgi:tetratricopeptide (TPR) repeat protein
MKHALIIFVFLTTLWLLPASPLPAEPSLEQAVQLFQDGQTAESLKAVQAYLQVWSGEPRGLFLQSLALERLGRTAEAIEAYRNLIKIHPEFPEPYNNLARLLASQGKLEEAKKTLYQALKTHPSYAIAHQNLIRIYSAMASQAYSRVLGTEGGSLQVSLDSLEKLAVTDNQTLLVDATMLALPVKPILAAAAAAAEATAKPPLAPEASSEPGPALAPAPVPGQDIPLAAVHPVVATDESIAEPTLTPQEQVPPSVHLENQQPVASLELKLQQSVKNILQEWAKAWAAQDVEAYLSFYSSSFVPEGSLDLAQWQEQRKVRVAAPTFIRLSLSEIEVSGQEQGIVQVRFFQHYRSNVINSRVRKELLFQQEHGQWRIIREWVLPR